MADRVRGSRRHLVNVVLECKAAGGDPPYFLWPEPVGVGNTACALCDRWCRTSGGETTITHVRRDYPGPDLWFPLEGRDGPCIFHGRTGCAPDRSSRSDVCDDDFRAGLDELVSSGEYRQPVVVISGTSDERRDVGASQPTKPKFSMTRTG